VWTIAQDFSDLPSGDWYSYCISFIYDFVLLQGTSASSFGRALQVRATPPGLKPGAHLLSYEYPGDSSVFSKKNFVLLQYYVAIYYVSSLL
jgi:hypothetical protein